MKFATKYAVWILFFAALGIRLWAITLDDVLSAWDEQYHAVVAKNLGVNPLRPLLLPTDPLPNPEAMWVAQHVWLHKQPLFLWLMSGSLGLFGLKVWAVRLPSVLLGALLSVLVYKTGKNLGRPRTGWMAGILVAISAFGLLLTNGKYPTDHNDIAFAFFITAGIWAWSRYTKNPSWRNIVLLGAATGCAVLTKWLLGFWLLGLFGLYGLWKKELGEALFWKKIAGVSLVALLIFVPWNVYVFSAFPVEAAKEWAYNGAHFFHSLEGHAHPWYYHTLQMESIFSPGAILLLSVGMGVSFASRDKAWLSLAVAWLLLLVFFSLAATKMMSFMYMAVSPAALLIGRAFEKGWEMTASRRRGRWVLSVGMFLFFAMTARWWEVQKTTQQENTFRTERKHFTRLFHRVGKESETGKWVFYNLPMHALPLALFYTDGTAYARILTSEERAQCLRKGLVPIDVKETYGLSGSEDQ